MRYQAELVCSDCFEDSGIIDFIERNEVPGVCSFCDGISHNVSVAALDNVLDHIEECIYQEYDRAANHLPYDMAEGGYIGTCWDAYDLLFDVLCLGLPQDDSGKLSARISKRFRNDFWCEISPFSLNDTQKAHFSWSHFCNVVMHQRRFFFADYPDDTYREVYSPSTVLEKIFDYAEKCELFVALPAGTQLFRARFQGCGLRLETAQDLGPPPQEKATQSNRMSPPGIPMFYAGEEVETALRETASGPGLFAVGHFETRRPAVLLDLTKIPPIPSLFQELSDAIEYWPREVSGFLNHIVGEMSQPIERGDRIHTEYVPTQVVTEYIRSKLLHEDSQIDGIKYPSAVHPGHASYVLFATQDNLLPKPEETDPLWPSPDEDRWLELTCVEVCPVNQEQIDHWKNV